MATLAHITDHQVRALDLVLSFFRDKPDVLAILDALTAEQQATEDGIWSVVEGIQLDNAVGVQLDLYGEILVEPRDGLTDDDYRGLLRAKIQTNLSQGEPWRLTAILAALLADALTIRYAPAYPAGYYFTVISSAPMSAALLAKVVEWMLDLQPSGVGMYSLIEGVYTPGNPVYVLGAAGDPSTPGLSPYGAGLGVGGFARDVVPVGTP